TRNGNDCVAPRSTSTDGSSSSARHSSYGSLIASASSCCHAVRGSASRAPCDWPDLELAAIICAPCRRRLRRKCVCRTRSEDGFRNVIVIFPDRTTVLNGQFFH